MLIYLNALPSVLPQSAAASAGLGRPWPMQIVLEMSVRRITTIGSAAAIAGLLMGTAISGAQAQQPMGFRYIEVNSRINYSLGLIMIGPAGDGATFGGIGSVASSGSVWNGNGGFRGRIRLATTLAWPMCRLLTDI